MWHSSLFYRLRRTVCLLPVWMVGHTFSVTCHYLSGFHWYQIIPVGDEGDTRVWTSCPKLLYSSSRPEVEHMTFWFYTTRDTRLWTSCPKLLYSSSRPGVEHMTFWFYTKYGHVPSVYKGNLSISNLKLHVCCVYAFLINFFSELMQCVNVVAVAASVRSGEAALEPQQAGTRWRHTPAPDWPR